MIEALGTSHVHVPSHRCALRALLASLVAMNPIIKFTTLFGLLAVELAEGLSDNTRHTLAGVFGIIMLYFVWRSFYMMRISLTASVKSEGAKKPATA